MALSVTHTFVSGIADDPTAAAAGEVLPSHWNASHTLTGQVDLTSQVTGILPTANGGTGTSTGYLPRTVNAQTGASYTIVASDIGKLVTTSNAGAVAVTLPQATGSFAAGAILWVENKGAGTATITPTTSTIDGSATLALTTNQGVTLVSDGTNWTTIRGIGGAGGGTPGGSSGQLQWNSSSAFAGVTGSSVSTNGSLTLGGATVTASDPVLSITQTFNNAAVSFTAIKVVVTNTASAVGSKVFDFQKAGTSLFWLDIDGTLRATFGASATGAILLDYAGDGIWLDPSSRGVNLSSGRFLTWTNGSANGGSGDTLLSRQGVGLLSLQNSVNATGFRVYNTTDSNTSPTNYERGVFDWTTSANVLTIGTQAGGTGTGRQVKIDAAGDVITLRSLSGGTFITGVFSWGTSTLYCQNTQAIGTTGGNRIDICSGYTLAWSQTSVGGTIDLGVARVVGGLLEVNNGSASGVSYLRLNAVTVASLPAASATYKGARGTVSDANATTFLSTVAGGGSNIVPVFCDGTAWKIG